jgi:hypothetical protein
VTINGLLKSPKGDSEQVPTESPIHPTKISSCPLHLLLTTTKGHQYVPDVWDNGISGSQ